MDVQSHKIVKGRLQGHYTGVLETWGKGPPTFAEISPKLLQNQGFSLKILVLCPPSPPPLWCCPPTSRQVPTPLLQFIRFDKKNLIYHKQS